VLCRGSIPSSGTGHLPAYYVQVFVDGGATCECRDFVIRGLPRAGLLWRCHHIRQAIADNGLEVPTGSPAVPARSGPAVPGEPIAVSGDRTGRRPVS
jgi:hypothetical protein